jgi:hypothetical protein
MTEPMLVSRRRRRVCAIGVLLLVLVAACNRLVNLTPSDAFDTSPDAADTDSASAIPPDAMIDAAPDAPEADAAPDAI